MASLVADPPSVFVAVATNVLGKYLYLLTREPKDIAETAKIKERKLLAVIMVLRYIEVEVFLFIRCEQLLFTGNVTYP